MSEKYDDTNKVPTIGSEENAADETTVTQPTDPLELKANKPAKKGKKSSKRRSKNKRKNSDDQSPPDVFEQETEEKPKRTPQLHTNEHIRGMLQALQAIRPGTTFTDLVEGSLQRECDQTAYLPPIQLRRLKADTLRTMAGFAAEAEARIERITRKIIKAKMNPEVEAKLTDELQAEVTGFGELRRTMMRQAAIPMVPNLPEDVSVGIVILEHEKLECPDESRQTECDTCIQILKAYRPIEYDLPEDLQDNLTRQDETQQ